MADTRGSNKERVELPRANFAAEHENRVTNKTVFDLPIPPMTQSREELGERRLPLGNGKRLKFDAVVVTFPMRAEVRGAMRGKQLCRDKNLNAGRGVSLVGKP